MNLKELKALAEKTTPGRFRPGHFYLPDPRGPDAEYVYAASPATILKLIQMIETMKEALEFYANNTSLDADDYDVETCDQADFDHHEYVHGKNAREALALEKELEGL